MQDAPEGGEVGVAVLVVAEDGFEVEFEEIRAREGIGIAEEAEGFAVGDDGPEAVAGGIEEFLSELVGGFFLGTCTSHGEAGIGVIEAEAVRRDDDGEAAAEGHGRDGEAAVAELDGSADRGQIGVAEALAQEVGDEGAGDGGGVEIGASHLRSEGLPGGGGDAEGAAVFVVELEALGDGVVGFLLKGRLAAGRAFEQLGHEERAFEPEGVERGGVGGFAAAGHLGVKAEMLKC